VARPVQVNVADAKRQFSRLLGRVAFAGETVIILRRGRPMAKLVPADAADGIAHLADVTGWLDDDDPFFAELADIEKARAARPPRVLRAPLKRRGER
jgi:prevent-host-death family protein